MKARLSDAFDRFLEGVADNRQVAFDDDGWRLKTDAAEQPDPAQSDSLAELHRWLDARSRSIRLADLLMSTVTAWRSASLWLGSDRRRARQLVRHTAASIRSQVSATGSIPSNRLATARQARDTSFDPSSASNSRATANPVNLAGRR